MACKVYAPECSYCLGIVSHFTNRWLSIESMIFSPDGICRPFDAETTVLCCNGFGIVVLRRLEDAYGWKQPITLYYVKSTQ